MDGARPTHVHVDDVDDEVWHDRDGSRLTWRTLVGRADSPTTSLSGGVAELAPGGGRLEQHRHAPAEVYHVLAGIGVVTVGDERFEVRTGSTVFIPPASWHAIENTGNDALRLFYCFPVDRFDDVRYEYASDQAPNDGESTDGVR
jgi:mannose-6-phosphate isomerase-like protein (cupin superfamily)